MTVVFDINNHEELLRLLFTLSPETKPLWGKMKAQQMIEHLIIQVEYTNGKKTPTLDCSLEEAQHQKQRLIYGDAEISRNIVMEALPDHFTHPDIATAAKQLVEELEAFDLYFSTPGKTEIHGGFGAMTHQEWLIWHGKHFTHHLKQFGLLPE